jgi:hypothetical protein
VVVASHYLHCSLSLLPLVPGLATYAVSAIVQVHGSVFLVRVLTLPAPPLPLRLCVV